MDVLIERLHDMFVECHVDIISDKLTLDNLVRLLPQESKSMDPRKGEMGKIEEAWAGWAFQGGEGVDPLMTDGNE